MSHFNPKIVMVGSGMIGGTLGVLAAVKKLSNNIVMLDVIDGMPTGKALDMAQALACEGVQCHFSGSGDIGETSAGLKDADVCIVTAGFPRMDGMTRDDLLMKNAEVITGLGKALKSQCPNAFVVCITNPLDVMVSLLQKVSGLPASHVVGMAGVLDTSRFRHFLAEELKVSPSDVHSLVLGGHGDEMVPMRSMTSVNGIPLDTCVQMGMISEEKLQAIIDRTRTGGAEIVKYLQRGSAFVAPAVAAIQMVESYLRDEKRVLPCCAHLSGEYGYSNMYAGVPCVIGCKGVERVLELPLAPAEKELFAKSMAAVQELSAKCPGLGC